MTDTYKKTTRRYWRHTSSTRPWWPWGLAPLAVLGILFLFGALFMAPRIEAEVRNEVTQHLDFTGLPSTTVRADGQGVVIETPAQATEIRHVEAFAAATRCGTWAGKLPCPTTIEIDSIAPAATPMIARTRPHPFSVASQGSVANLSGEVPDLEEQERLLSLASSRFTAVTHSLTISNEAAGEMFSTAADRAIVVASGMEDGRASWSGAMFSVDGTAQASAIPQLREEFGAIGSEALQGEFNVRALRDFQQCNIDFNDMLTKASIRFQVSSATIDVGNEDLLDRLAGVAKSCPGALVIQGHTDSQGDAEMNEALSNARAAAVRDALVARGVSSERLAAVGFGETRPIAGNDTASGRAKNRRIAITIED